MIRRAGAPDRHFAILQLLGGAAVAVLIFFHAFRIDQVSDVDQHPLRSHFLAANFFFQGIEQFVDLHGKSARLGLALTFPRSLHPQLGQIIAANRIGELNIDHRLAQGTVTDDEFDVHLGLPLQLGYAQAKGAPVNPDCLAESVVAVENGSNTEGEDGKITEAETDDPGVIDLGLMIEFAGCVVIFAYDDREFTTGIAENRRAVYALNTFEQEWAASAGSIGEGLVLGETVRVPRHILSLRTGTEAD